MYMLLCMYIHVRVHAGNQICLFTYIGRTGDSGGVTLWLGYAVSLVLLGSGGGGGIRLNTDNNYCTLE